MISPHNWLLAYIKIYNHMYVVSTSFWCCQCTALHTNIAKHLCMQNATSQFLYIKVLMSSHFSLTACKCLLSCMALALLWHLLYLCMTHSFKGLAPRSWESHNNDDWVQNTWNFCR